MSEPCGVTVEFVDEFGDRALSFFRCAREEGHGGKYHVGVEFGPYVAPEGPREAVWDDAICMVGPHPDNRPGVG